MTTNDLESAITHLVDWARTLGGHGFVAEAEKLLDEADNLTYLLDLREAFRGRMDQSVWRIV